MLGTSVGIFWVDQICRPGVRELLKHPLVLFALVCLLYAYVGYKVLKASYLSDDT